MKTLMALAITLFSMNTFAAQINGGAYNQETDSIQLEVVYQGGCKEHNFEVRLNSCNRATPATCTADLVDHTEDDVCRGFVQKTISIPAAKALGSYEIDRLLIRGDNESAVLIDLF